jgi:FO synthase
MQGGIHPSYTGHTYLHILETVKAAAPAIHVHAFSPLEVSHGAATLGDSIASYLSRLRDAGLGSLPGTAAEILDDEARAVLCPDKLDTERWLSIMESAHRAGLRSTATIMFGHIERVQHWARHLLRIRDLQERTGGFTEFVPLPFIHMEAPLYRKGRAREGPTWREALLMHAVARLALHPVLPNIQASWVKLGPEGARAALAAGANDLGGTLTNESISKAAGTVHGQEYGPAEMEALIRLAGREPAQRTTLYQTPPAAQRARAFAAAPAAPIVLTPIRRRAAAAPATSAA